MEFDFGFSNSQAITGMGEITDYSLHSVIREVSTIDLTLRVTSWEVKSYGEITQTWMVQLPGCSEILRVGGTRSITVNSEVSLISTISVTLLVKGIYKSYDEACAAEMQDKMERSK